MTALKRSIERVWPLTRLVVAAGTLLLTGACASSMPIPLDTPAPLPAYVAFEESGKSWWRVNFKLAWDQEEEPNWHVDVLLADQVMAPIIAHGEPRIFLWRFHRRASTDEAGHRFSFIFYADPETAAMVNNGIENSLPTARLVEEGIVQEVRLAELDETAAQDIGATSDPHWPEALRRGWPWFIMGVSQSWLRLIDETKANRPPPEATSTSDLLEYYRDLHEEVSSLWREHGQHAYLHHLNAVFGYQLLIIRETNLKRF